MEYASESSHGKERVGEARPEGKHRLQILFQNLNSNGISSCA